LTSQSTATSGRVDSSRARRYWGALLALLAVAGAMFAARFLGAPESRFVDWPLPQVTMDRLFDIGIVDANGDDLLDVYTSNHHFRQSLLVAERNGEYRDAIAPWGLDQSKDFPLAELSFTGPTMDRPGLYVFWLGTDVLVQAHELDAGAVWRGEIRMLDPVKIMKADGVAVELRNAESKADESVISFTGVGNALLRMRPGGQGLPITFRFDDPVRTNQVYVGRGKVLPKTRTFVLAMLDRHAMAWADYNGDGVLDFFTNRGGLGGTLPARDEAVRRNYRDELFLSEGDARFAEVAPRIGIEKKGCSGRHARWLDLDRDGRLELFVNCYERGNVEGRYPKQVWRADESGRMHDVAEEVGLGLPDQQIGSFSWFDVDGDVDVDLVAFQHEGLFL